MAATPDEGMLDLVARRHRPGCLAHRVGEGNQVIVARRGRTELAVVADQIPPPRCGQPAGMRLAEVVRVRLGERRQWTDDRGRLCVDIRQRRDGLSGASVARASPWGPHGGTVSPRCPYLCAVGARHAVTDLHYRDQGRTRPGFGQFPGVSSLIAAIWSVEVFGCYAEEVGHLLDDHVVHQVGQVFAVGSPKLERAPVEHDPGRHPVAAGTAG